MKFGTKCRKARVFKSKLPECKFVESSFFTLKTAKSDFRESENVTDNLAGNTKNKYKKYLVVAGLGKSNLSEYKVFESKKNSENGGYKIKNY